LTQVRALAVRGKYQPHHYIVMIINYHFFLLLAFFFLSFVQILLGTPFTFMKDLQFNYQRDTGKEIM